MEIFPKESYQAEYDIAPLIAQPGIVSMASPPIGFVEITRVPMDQVFPAMETTRLTPNGVTVQAPTFGRAEPELVELRRWHQQRDTRETMNGPTYSQNR